MLREKRTCACGEVEIQITEEPFYEHDFESSDECAYCGAVEATSGLTYALTADGKGYELTAIPDSIPVIVVDNVHEGKPVVGIAAGAFKNPEAPQNVPQNNDTVTSVIINRGIKYIGGGAFYKCVALVTVELPETLTSIESNAFYGCAKLKDVILPESLTSIGASAFSKCVSLEEIDCPDSLKAIGGSAFEGCTSLTTVDLGGVESLGSSAFYGCTTLSDLNLENAKITRVRSYTFYNCGKLTSVTLPATVTAIDSAAFGNCSELSAVNTSGITVAPDAFEGTQVN